MNFRCFAKEAPRDSCPWFSSQILEAESAPSIQCCARRNQPDPSAELQDPRVLAVSPFSSVRCLHRVARDLDSYNRGTMQLRVDDALFERFPDLAIGVVIAVGIDNHRQGEAAAAFLRERVDAIRSSWSPDRLEADSRIAAWREAYRSFGAKPKKHRCSVENMIRSILEGEGLHPINAAVATYNAISLKHGVPAGGDDLDRVVGDIVLTFAEGDERFVPLNGTEPMPPKPGEVIYRDDEDVLCRRWNWRECDKSKMTADSRNLCLVVEGLPPVSREDVRQVSTELCDDIATFCGGSTDVQLVDRDAPEVRIRKL